MPSIPFIQRLIDQANINQSGLVVWDGTQGERAIFTAINERLRDTGVMFVADTTALSLIGAADARVVLVDGVGLYVYNANGTNPGPDDIVSSSGGVWMLIISSTGGIAQYDSLSDFPSGGISTVLYIAKDTGVAYYWSSGYNEVEPSIWQPLLSKLTLPYNGIGVSPFAITLDGAGVATIEATRVSLVSPTEIDHILSVLSGGSLDMTNGTAIRGPQGLNLLTTSTDPITFSVNSVEGMRLATGNTLLIGTTTVVAGSIFTVDSTTRGSIPFSRMTTTQANTLATSLGTSDKGTCVYDTTIAKIKQWNGTAFETVTSV